MKNLFKSLFLSVFLVSGAVAAPINQGPIQIFQPLGTGGGGGGSGCTPPGILGEVLYDNGAGGCSAISGATTNGTTLTLVAPILGTPTSGTLTNTTGLPLSTGVVGNLAVSHLNSGTGASSSTFWKGDGTWGTAVTSVGLTAPGIFTVTNSPITGSGSLGLVAAGTSGGIPYFNSATTLASSAALTANAPVIGGGAGVAPTVGSRSGNTTVFATTSGILTNGDCVQFDISGNLVDAGAACGSAGAGITQLTGDVTAGPGSGSQAATVANLSHVTNASLANTGLVNDSTTVNGQTCTLGSTCSITASLTVGTSTVTSGTTNGLLYDNAGVLGNLATTNSGVLVTSGLGAPSISTTLPNGLALGTPGSVTLTNGTGLPISTGVSGLGTGIATFLATPSSANLASTLTDETGSGLAVFATSPTLVTPTIGAATATSINKVTITAPATGSTLTIVNGKTFTASNTLTLAGVDGSTLSIGSGGNLGSAAFVNTGTSGGTLGLLNTANLWSGAQTFANSDLLLQGSSTGTTTFTSDNVSASNFSVHIPSVNDTMAVLTAVQTLTNKTISGSSNTVTNIANASLVNSSTTVNGQTCTLGSTCTVATGLTVGTSTITSGTTNGLLYDNAGVLGNLATANSGVLITSSLGAPSISTTLPNGLALGVPGSVTLTNGTGLPISSGVSGLGAGMATFLGTPSSANLIATVTDETGTGSLVFSTSPTLVSPDLGTPIAAVGTNFTGTAASLTAGHVTTNANLTGVITSVGNTTSIASQTGTGSKFVVDTSPTLVTPNIGVATATSINFGGGALGIYVPWTNVSFNAGNFTGSGTLAWTVTSGEVLSYKWTQVGKTMTVAFEISNSTVSGTGTFLQIAIPNGAVATTGQWGTLYAIDNGTPSTAPVRVLTSGTVIQIGLVGLPNWSASTTNTSVLGQITFQVN